MIDLYATVALSTRMIGSRTRADYRRNLSHITDFMDVACNIAATEGAPVKLVVLSESAIQGFPLAKFRGGDRKHEAALAVEIPGSETDALGQKARALGTYIAGELYLVRDPSFPDRYFNMAFLIDPVGAVICTRAKLQIEPLEAELCGTTCPHDVWDEWITVKGNGNAMDALFPVARTEIGNIGMLICMEGGYPEIARGLALNGAEILTRPTYHDPYVNNGWWELQNRSHAMFNNAYVIAPNNGVQHLTVDGPPLDICGGQSMIVDYRGQVQIKRDHASGDSMVSSVLDLQALRRFRVQNGFGSWLKDLRTEQFAVIYEREIYPRNQYLTEAPTLGWQEREESVLASSRDRLLARGVLMAPDADGGSNGRNEVAGISRRKEAERRR